MYIIPRWRGKRFNAEHFSGGGGFNEFHSFTSFVVPFFVLLDERRKIVNVKI